MYKERLTHSIVNIFRDRSFLAIRCLLTETSNGKYEKEFSFSWGWVECIDTVRKRQLSSSVGLRMVNLQVNGLTVGSYQGVGLSTV